MNLLKQFFLPLIGLCLVVACAMNRESVQTYAPELAPRYEAAEQQRDALGAELEAAKADVEAAKLTPETSDDEAADARVQALVPQIEALEAEFRDLELAFNRRQTEPFLGPLDAFVPGAKELIGLGLLPLLGKRSRKHYLNAAKRIPKGQLLVALGDVLKAFGLQHSSPESAAAAEVKKT